MTFHAICARVMRGAACSPRERSARRAARDASPRPPLALVCTIILQMVVTLVFPCGAYALTPNDQGVLWGPTSLGGGNSGIVVSATNNFDAALWAIGRWNTKIQLSHEMFARLSNEGTGGHFYELASYFHSYSEVGSPNWPNAAAVEGYAISLGPDNVWLASVPSSLIADARRDYNTVLGGGTLGGGGGSGGEVVGEVAYLTFGGNGSLRKLTTSTSTLYSGWPSAFTYAPSTGATGITGPFYTNGYYMGEVPDNIVGKDAYRTFRLFVPKDWFEQHPPSEWDYIMFPRATYGSTSRTNATNYDVLVTLKEHPFELGTVEQHITGTKQDGTTVDFTNTYTTARSNGQFYGLSLKTDSNKGCNWTFSGSAGGFSIQYVSGVVDLTSFNVASNTGTGGLLNSGNAVYPLLGAGTTPLPPNNWPEDDPTPTPDPPEVPGPSDDPVVSPEPPDLPNPVEYPVSDPYTPDPDPPANPIITYDPNPTGEPTDYRPWLNAILVLLRKINTTIADGFGDLRGYLTNHCDHIREQIHSDSLDLGLHIQTAIENGVVSFERWLQGTFSGYFLDEIDYLLGENFRELEGYLYELFHWLASQFDFTFGGTNYDDSSVIYWLRRIYARLGGGAPNPGDDGTVDEGFDWWAWLLGLITDALGGIITDFVGDVGGFLATLADVFPFSIPGDIVAYLSLLDAARETPNFVITIPAIQGWWDSYEFEIDLAPYDDAMGVVRGMVLIYWGFVLVLKTDWLGGVFDFATRSVVSFFDKITGGAYSA